MNVCPNISVKEVVCPHMYSKYGDRAIRFIDKDLIAVLDIVRNKILKCPIIINNGGSYTQRGFRCNICPLVAEKTKAGKMYLSGHNMGKAVDFSCNKYSVVQIHKMIKDNADLLPCKIRLESPLDASSWIHIDVMNYGQNEKVYVFRA